MNKMLEQVFQNRIWRSMFRHGLPESNRTRAETIFYNFFLHVHPTKARKRSVRFGYTWGLGGSCHPSRPLSSYAAGLLHGFVSPPEGIQLGHRRPSSGLDNSPELYRISPAVGSTLVLGNLGRDQHGSGDTVRAGREDFVSSARRKCRGRKCARKVLRPALFHHPPGSGNTDGNPFL